MSLLETSKDSPCVLHTPLNSIDEKGYGLLKVDGRTKKAHRVAFEKAYGPIPQGMCVLHRCDVRNCVNPDHLFLGTQIENIEDRDRKGRFNRKLTDEQVRFIRDNRNFRADFLANHFNVSIYTIYDIRNPNRGRF